MDYSLPGSFIHETFQARILEQVAIPLPLHPRTEPASLMSPASYPSPKVRGGGLEEQLHIHGAVAVQEGREELLQVHSQEGRL